MSLNREFRLHDHPCTGFMFNTKGLSEKNTGEMLLSQIYLYQNISGKLWTTFFVMLNNLINQLLPRR
jgi:hypothetical protein